MKLKLRCLAPMVAALVPTVSQAQVATNTDLGSVNLDQVQRFFHAVESSNRPVRVMAFGDSMCESWKSIQIFLFRQLERDLGPSGYGLTDFWLGNTYATAGGGATWVRGPSAWWWTDSLSLPPGGWVSWTNAGAADFSILCDEVGFFWIAQPAGGPLTLSVATGGGAWTPLLNVDGYAATPTGRFTNVAVVRRSYQMRVDAPGGTNIVVGPHFLDRATNGVQISFMDRDGANLHDVYAVPTNVMVPILLGAKPDLIVWHMKEVADIGEAALPIRMDQVEALLQATLPEADVVYLGTPYEYRDASAEFTPRQNRIVRAAALRHHRAYVDCMTPCVSYQTMVNRNWLHDGIHPNNTCNAVLADLVRRELGFYALRVERRLAGEWNPAGFKLSWPTKSNLTYTLETAATQGVWSPLRTNPGSGQVQSWTNATSAPQQFFRLQLAP